MAEDDLTTHREEQEAPGKPEGESRGCGPATVAEVKKRLEMMVGIAFLGKLAFEEGDTEAWSYYLKETGCPFKPEHLIEAAFEGLFKTANEAWYELCFPKDYVHGRLAQEPATGDDE